MDSILPARETTAGQAGRSWVAAMAVGIALIVALVRLVRLIRVGAVNLPFQDQWDLLRPLFNADGPGACFFLQHGPHRQGLGGVLQWYLYRATQWDVRAEAWAGVVVLSLAATLAVLIARRLRGRLAWSDVAFPLLLLAPIHWETLLLTPNLAHGILPVLLTMGLAGCWTIGDPRCRGASLAVVGVLALFTGFAICAFVTCLALLFLQLLRPAGSRREEKWRTVLGLLGFAIAGGAFLIGYTWSPAVPNWRFPAGSLLNYPRFLALMNANLLGWRENTAMAASIGSVLLVAVVAACGWGVREIWRGDPTRRGAVVLQLTGTSLLFGGFTAVGRLPAGIEAAFMWRYLPLLVPAVVGLALALENNALFRGSGGRVIRGGLVAVALLAWANVTPDRHAAVIATGKRLWIERYLATRDLAAANREADFFVYRGDPESAVIAERLRWLQERRLTFFRDAVPP